MKKKFRINWSKSPWWFKKMIAKLLLRMFKVEHMENDMILYNELKLWIDTDGRPTTSNVNYHINKSS